VVKVIWHKTASPPQMDGSTVFVRWCQCAQNGMAHWRHRLNLCFLRPIRVHNLNGKSIGLAISTAPFPQNCPFPPGIWTPSNTRFLRPIWAHKPNGIFIGSAVFAQTTAECPYSLQWDAPFSPQNCPFPWGHRAPNLIHGSLGPPESSTQMASRSVQLFLQS